MSNGDLEDLDHVSTIWILACIDENHLITYEGIRERLGLDVNFDVKGLVFKHRELFRPGAPTSELSDWKDAMKNGKRLPTWIKQISDKTAQSNRIDCLSENDIFRSQFRAYRAAPKSEVTIVTWGLDHIDRIRKGKIATREANAKSWQMWLVFAIGIANIITTLVVGFAKSNDNIPIKSTPTVTQPIKKTIHP